MRRSSFRSAVVGAGLLVALAGAQGAGAQETEKSPTSLYRLFSRISGGASAKLS